jgi:Rieske Fe-S protein
MRDHNNPSSDSNSPEEDEPRSRARRKFLLAVPAAVFASIGATLAAAAFRFLRPPQGPTAGGASADSWAPLAPVAELTGVEPLLRKVVVERTDGWSRTREERSVYVLPGRDAQASVVSAICPHEGCEVAWRAEARDFFCPCHDSRFDAAGARLGGPAERDLPRLPTRVENGVLQVQYREAQAGRAAGQGERNERA